MTRCDKCGDSCSCGDEIPRPKGLGIVEFFHCKKCQQEKPDDIAPRDWAKFDVGWTVKGLQVWCARHEVNVINIDFRGQKIDLV